MNERQILSFNINTNRKNLFTLHSTYIAGYKKGLESLLWCNSEN